MPRVVTEPAETLALFRSACDWAEHVSLCLARCDSGKGGLEAWRALERYTSKLDLAIVSLDSGCAEPLLVRALNGRGVLRIAPGTPAVMNANVYLFRRGSEARVLLGSADFTHTGFERGVSATVYAAGHMSDEFFCGVRRLLLRCSRLAHVPTLQDVDIYLRNWTRNGSSLPPSATSIAAIPIHEALRLVELPEQMDTCVRLLATAVHSAQKNGEIRVLEEDTRWRLRFGGEGDGARIDVSIAKSGADARCDAAFVEGVESGRTYLAYRALFRSRARVAEHLFWASTRYRPVQLSWSADAPEGRAAVVCEMGTIEAADHLVGFAAELRRVRDCADESDQDDDQDEALDFLNEEPDVQAELVWNVLIGDGPLEKDEAIRAAAQSLRAEGAIRYKRLDRGGQVYAAIERAIDAGAKDGHFDRPHRGYVRAVATDLGADEWRHCLLAAVQDQPTERTEAIRAAGEYAKEHFGIQFERLRRGGRIDKAVRSAINSCLRRGLIQDLGRDLIQVVER